MIFNVINAATSKLVSISVVNSQSTYQYYADINRSALTVTATYKNGNTKVVTSYSISPTKASSDTIYVYYSENGVTALATFNITILGVLEGIAAMPSKGAYEYAEAVGATTTAYYNDGTSAIVTGSVFSPSSATDTNIGVSYTENGITKTYTMPIRVYPSASQYTGGNAEITNEGSGEWTMECLTSGTLDLRLPYDVDIWCVGGGGGGGYSNSTVYNGRGGGGGGGGYTSLGSNLQVNAETTYSINVGAGGSGGTTMSSDRNIGQRGGTGGTSSGLGVSASGGIGGRAVNTNNSSTTEQMYAGGNGGSGGGGISVKTGSNATYCNGGSNGANGNGTRAGLGSGTITRDFAEPSGTLRAGGGGGGTYYTGSVMSPGGAGGGGNGGNASNRNAQSGSANYGGGGGGGGMTYTNTYYNGNGGSGGSGIVIVRTHRDTSITKFNYEFDGFSSYMQETNDDWYLSVTGSGTLTVKENTAVDIYLLGGGQSGYKGETNTYGGYSGTFYVGGAGGQGGFVNVLSNVTLTAGDYVVTIGNGGTGNGGVGGTTSLGTYQAPGGGSGATGYSGGASGGNAGAMSGSSVPTAGGAGADSTVYDFNGVNRGGGGGGGYGARYNSLSDSWSYNWSPASGGDQGGARSMTSSSGGQRTATVNYGGGGSGNTGNSTGGGAGGSGYILIRNHRS